MTEFKLNGQKTYLSLIVDGCTQEMIAYSISRSPILKQIMDMLKQAWRKHSKFQAWLKDHGIEQSMSRKGNSLDDGLMKGSFAYSNGKCSMALKPSLRI